jgi:hypothetical protein
MAEQNPGTGQEKEPEKSELQHKPISSEIIDQTVVTAIPGILADLNVLIARAKTNVDEVTFKMHKIDNDIRKEVAFGEFKNEAQRNSTIDDKLILHVEYNELRELKRNLQYEIDVMVIEREALQMRYQMFFGRKAL